MPASKKVSKTISTPVDPYVGKLLEKISVGKHNLSRRVKLSLLKGIVRTRFFFVQSGKVKISVVSASAREAILVMLGPLSFFGEGALVGQSLRMSTATALEPSTIFRVEKAMVRALHEEAALSEKFIAALLVRNIELEEDLCDQLFNPSEKRLARVLLKLARLREQDALPDATFPTLSHETLAEMVGTTRSRVPHFMNKFRTMRLIDYNNDGFTVRTELLTDLVLQ